MTSSGPDFPSLANRVGPRLELSGLTLNPGEAAGTLLALQAPLSFWGGTDLATGVVIDEHHPQHGLGLAGRILAMRAGRGSSSSSSVLAEQIRSGAAPAAIILASPDAIVALGALVAAELYGLRVPVVQVSDDDFMLLETGRRAQVRAADAGHILLEMPAPGRR